MEIKSVVPAESGYLKRLEYIKNPPKHIYYYGNIPECNQSGDLNPRFPLEERGRPKTVAIIGSRKMTTYGETWAYKIAKELAEVGVIVVSGLAIGVDSVAHKGALDGNGKTIAFLGTSITQIYPAENRELFKKIINRDGCVLSEYEPGMDTGPRMRTNSFLLRNRLIAGVADAVVVIEADERSGSLNTASHALEQGVPLFALPGDTTRQMSRGCNRLFNKGATAITSVDDIYAVLFPGGVSNKKLVLNENIPLNVDEKMIFDLISNGYTSGEEIIQNITKKELKFDVARFNIAITTMELKGIVKREYGNQWILA